MTKKKHFENCGRTDGRTTDATPWHKLIGPFGPDELIMRDSYAPNHTNEIVHSCKIQIFNLIRESSIKKKEVINDQRSKMLFSTPNTITVPL